MRHSPSHGERMAVIKDVLAHIDDTARHERRVSRYSASLRSQTCGEPSADNYPQGTAHLAPSLVSERYRQRLGMSKQFHARKLLTKHRGGSCGSGDPPDTDTAATRATLPPRRLLSNPPSPPYLRGRHRPIPPWTACSTVISVPLVMLLRDCQPPLRSL
jgi:hypothetical protein